MAVTNKKRRRLIQMKINEVSLVDSPANKQPFLIFKRNQEGDMGEIQKAISDLYESLAEVEISDDIYKKAKVKDSKKEDFVNFILQQIAIGETDEKEIAKEWLKLEKVKKEGAIPIPKEGESEEDFVARCSKYLMDEEGMEEKEAMGVAKEQWDKMMAKVKKSVRNDEDLSKDFFEIIDLAKAGRKISSKNLELIKSAMDSLSKILASLQEQQKELEESELQKQFDALSKEQQSEIMKQLQAMKQSVDKILTT